MNSIDTDLFGTVHRPKKINSKVKGNRNELVAAKALTKWTGHEFVRIPMSGGLRWNHRMDTCGDLINADPDFDFIFSVETKAIKNLGIMDGFKLRENSKIYGYLEQCERDAKASGKLPFLMIRENNMSAGLFYIFLQLDLEQQMKIHNYVESKVFMPISARKIFLFGFHSEIFFNSITYKQLKWVYNG